MIKKKYYTNSNIKSFILEIISQMFKDKFRPDYIIGLVRGGVTPATMISHYLNIPCYTLDVRLRDHGGTPESNLSMAQDAFGYTENTDFLSPGELALSHSKNMLLVDDINDSGATFNWIKEDWQGHLLPEDTRWNNVWGNNVKVAVLTENLASEFGDVSYYADTVNKVEDDVWLVYPWEEWWSDKTD